MPKGFFSQGLAVLLSQPLSTDELREVLAPFQPRGPMTGQPWEFGEESFVVPIRQEVNGFATIDVTNRPWPDAMGDPKTESTLFGAWTMGYFGPYTFPQALLRATQQSWTWPAGREIARRHQAFIRVRSSYVLGADEDTPILPEDYDSLAELRQLTELTEALLKHPHALCYFNPGGELVLGPAEFASALKFAAEHQRPPIEAWTNVRMFRIDDQWMLMDSIGMEQLDVIDHEACFPPQRYNPSEVAHFLRNSTLYTLSNGEIIKDADTMDGPGGVRWQARRFEKSIASRPREVLRWLPCDGSKIPQRFLE